MGTFQPAYTAGDGRLQVGLEPSYWSVPTALGEHRAPAFNVAARYGVTQRFDLGARFGGGGLDLSGKFQLTDPQVRSLVVSLAPNAGGIFVQGIGGGTGFVAAQLPVLVGIGLGDVSQVVLGPRVHYFTTLPGGCGPASAVSVGSSAGVVVSVSKLALMPEVTVLVPVSQQGGCSGNGPSSGFGSERGVHLQAGVGVLFGGLGRK
jgi:hypothetical protein